MGFCRTNLFKRLESGGPAFIQSVERHILRNYVYLHAIEHGLPLPLGTQDAELLDPRPATRTPTRCCRAMVDEDDEETDVETLRPQRCARRADYRQRAARGLRRNMPGRSRSASSGCAPPSSSPTLRKT